MSSVVENPPDVAGAAPDVAEVETMEAGGFVTVNVSWNAGMADVAGAVVALAGSADVTVLKEPSLLNTMVIRLSSVTVPTSLSLYLTV